MFLQAESSFSLSVGGGGGGQFTSFESQANRGFSSGIRVCYYISTSLSLPPVSLFCSNSSLPVICVAVVAMPSEF